MNAARGPVATPALRRAVRTMEDFVARLADMETTRRPPRAAPPKATIKKHRKRP
jgi:hypothetical protein